MLGRTNQITENAWLRSVQHDNASKEIIHPPWAILRFIQEIKKQLLVG